MMLQPETRKTFATILAEDGHDHLDSFLHTYAHYFDGVALEGRRVLEIGSGTGTLSLYMALTGASVVSMEPEMWGSTPGAASLQAGRAKRLGVALEFLDADFNAWDFAGRQFDVIVLEACINHLHESEHSALAHPPTFDAYRGIAQRMLALLAPGGVVVASDASRHAFFTMAKNYGIRRPWNWTQTSINWRVHQNGRTWAQIFKSAGFSSTQVDYPVPLRLSAFKPIVNTSLANFFLQGRFILKAWR